MADGNGNGTRGDRVARHSVTAVAGASVGILLTYISAVSGQSAELARLTERVESLSAKINQNMDDRYRGTDAERDFRIRDYRIQQNAEHIDEVQKCCERHRNEHSRDSND